MKTRTAVVGDTHGCAKTLRALLAKISLKKGDKLVTVGDHCDRGPDTRGVVTALLAEKYRGIKLNSVLGNHDAMLIAVMCLADKWRNRFSIVFPEEFWQSAIYPKNGLLQTADSYGWDWPLFREAGYQRGGIVDFFRLALKVYVDTDGLCQAVADVAESVEMPASHVDFFRSLRPCYHDPELDIVVVHAEFTLRALQRRNVKSAMRSLTLTDVYESLLWGKKWFNRKPRFGTKIIHGHTHLRHHPLYEKGETVPRLIKGKMDLDTGASNGGPMTAVLLPSWEIVQQENLDF